MKPDRMNAFSDGVLAILITILVLELRPPPGHHLSDILDVKGKLLAYLLSFVMIGIYWNNHHHLIHAVHEIRGGVLWANLHLLFWLSLIPFVTGWMGENHFATVPVAAYGFVLFMCAVAYSFLVRCLTVHQRENKELAEAIGGDRKGWISLALYLSGVVLAFVHPWLGFAVYIGVAMIWFVPDRRIENRVGHG
jgi:uncharacterized membrane protein